MRGHLQLYGPDGLVEFDAMAVRYQLDDSERVSFHHRLGRYQGQTGCLRFDDVTSVDVVVNGGWLEVKR